jgi:hypothetical protein
MEWMTPLEIKRDGSVSKDFFNKSADLILNKLSRD